MKQPSDRTRALISELQNLYNPLCERTSKGEPEEAAHGIELIKQIAACGDWTAIPSLMSFLSSEPVVADAAGAAVESLVSAMRPTLLLELDERARGSAWLQPPRLSLGEVIKKFVSKTSSEGVKRPGVLGTATFHRNGYVREAALFELAQIEAKAVLPFLLIRLNDWVPQVRATAEKALTERMRPEYVQSFIDNLGLVHRISQRTRGGLKTIELTQRITSMLIEEQNIHLLFDGLEHRDYEVSRECLKLLTQSQSESKSTERIIDLIICHKDFKNRLMVFELAKSLPVEKQDALMLQLTDDKTPSVRRLALEALCETAYAQSESLLKKALLDKAAVVRDHARWKLQKLGYGINFRQFYIDQLQSGGAVKLLTASIAGLAETGKTADAELILPFVDHPRTTVRKSAIKSLAGLAANDYQNLFLSLLTNPLSSISNAATNALSQTISGVDANELWSALVDTQSWYVKRNVLKLLNQMNKWDRLSYLLLAVSQPDAAVREMALHSINMWVHEYSTSWRFTEPNAAQIERLAAGFPGARASLSTFQIQMMQEILQVVLKQ